MYDDEHETWVSASVENRRHRLNTVGIHLNCNFFVDWIARVSNQFRVNNSSLAAAKSGSSTIAGFGRRNPWPHES